MPDVPNLLVALPAHPPKPALSDMDHRNLDNHWRGALRCTHFASGLDAGTAGRLSGSTSLPYVARAPVAETTVAYTWPYDPRWSASPGIGIFEWAPYNVHVNALRSVFSDSDDSSGCKTLRRYERLCRSAA